VAVGPAVGPLILQSGAQRRQTGNLEGPEFAGSPWKSAHLWIACTGNHMSRRANHEGTAPLGILLALCVVCGPPIIAIAALAKSKSIERRTTEVVRSMGALASRVDQLTGEFSKLRGEMGLAGALERALECLGDVSPSIYSESERLP
jgi:hypothetical protein